MTTPALHPRMAEVITALRDAQQEMEVLIGGVAPDMAEKAPGSSAWSVAQIVEHLAIVEDGIGRLVSKLLKQVDGTSDPSTEPIAPTLARFQVEDARVTPIDAPDMVVPRGTMALAQAIEAQATARARLIGALTAASGRALGTATAPHPVLGELDGYQWALFPALHQRRHLHQMRRTLALLST